MTKYLTAILTKEDDMFAAFCPELDIASQGKSVEEAKSNLAEAVELFFETASKNEIEERLKTDIFISPLEVAIA
ncbi:MAG: type II toxin-antitoxin system HicB family antitoxin [Thermodesulfatator sp.]|nr:MAG: type II toxin-antitoxin system HicB family antitoxin [Thermodesulfatator sp.]